MLETCTVVGHDTDSCYVRYLEEKGRGVPILIEHHWMVDRGFRLPPEQGGGPAFYYTGCLPSDSDGPHAVFSRAGERLSDNLPSAAAARLAISEFACAVHDAPLLRQTIRRLSAWVGTVQG
jgi:hypothetical protein